jgi:hypothetical protein
MHPLLADPWVATRIEAAVAPYRGLISDEDLAFMRETLADLLATDEHAARILRRAKPRHVDQSGEAFIGRVEQEPGSPGKRRAGGDE